MKFLRAKAFCFALVFCAGASTLTSASGNAAPLSDYLFQVWQTDQGLPENSATAMVQTPDGYLWFGTFNGLVRFDGVKFKVFDRSNTPELPGTGIVNLYLDHSGRLWVSTLTGTAYVKDGRWRIFHDSDGWPGSYVWRFAETSSGDLYLTTWDHKLLRFRSDRFELIPQPPVSRPTLGFQSFVDGADDLWVVHPQFIGKLVGDKWQEMIPVVSLMGHVARGDRPGVMAGASRNGGFWIATSRELRKYDESRLVFRTPAPWLLQSLWSLYEDSDGAVWIASSANGLYQFSQEKGWQHFTTEQGLSYRAVRFVFEDREHNLWVGTSGGGLERFKRRSVSHWGVAQGLPDPIVKSIVTDAAGRVYFGTFGKGVSQLKGGRIVPVLPRWEDAGGKKTSIVSPDHSYPWFGGLVVSSLLDRRGRLWVSTYNDGLFVLDGHVLRSFFGSSGHSPQLAPLFEDSQGRIWAGAREGVYRWEGSGFQKYPLEGAPPRSSVRSFAEETRNGTVWIGDDRSGIYRFEGTRFVPVREASELSGQSITALLADNDGTLWIGTEDGGLANLRNGHLFRIFQAQGLPSRGVVSILDDQSGNLWFGSNRGILRISRKDLEDLIQGQKSRIEFRVLNQSDGMATTDCTMYAQPVAARDAKGRLWFATSKGVAMIDPRTLRLNRQLPPVAIEEVLIDDHPISLGAGFPTANPIAPNSIDMPAGEHRLEIHYSGLSFTAPEKVRFRVMLEGFDKTWIDVGGRRTAYFQNVRSGTYHFRVKAVNNDGVWNEAGAEVALYFRPHFYETLWFYTACVLGAVILGITAHRRRLQAVRSRTVALEELVEARTRDLSKQHAFLQQILDINPNFIFAKDREGRYTLVNRALAEFFRSTPQKLVGLRDEALGVKLSEVAAFRRDDREVLDTAREKFIPEEPVTDTEGRLHWFETLKRPILGEHGRADQVLGVASDITMRKLAEEQLSQYREHLEREVADRTSELTRANAQLRHEIAERERLEEQLRQAQKMEAVGTLSGGIAHDFNNLLTIIKGYALMVLARVQAERDLLDYVRRIDEATERAASLISQLLAFSRRQVLQPKVLNLNSVLLNLNRMLERLVGEDIERVVRPAADLESIKADPGQLEQVIMNLVVNARDAMPHGGRLTIETANVDLDEAYARDHVDVRPGRYAMLAVADTGIGMDGETLAHIFEPFFTTKERGRGTGLGLSTVYGIVRQSEGHIWVSTQPQRGTTFKVYFPAVTEAAQIVAEPEILPAYQQGSGTILLVEDDHEVRELVASILVTAGYKVLSAETGITALSICDTHPGSIELLITDVVMPGLSGRQLANLVIAKRSNIKVLYMSGYTTDAIVHHGVLDPGTFFLQKPFTPTSLTAKVLDVLTSSSGKTLVERKSA